MKSECVGHELIGQKHAYTFTCMANVAGILAKNPRIEQVGKLVMAIDEPKYEVGKSYKITVMEE